MCYKVGSRSYESYTKREERVHPENISQPAPQAAPKEDKAPVKVREGELMTEKV